MTQKEQLLSYLQNYNGSICDDCLAELLSIPQRQTTNRYCREYSKENKIRRDEGCCTFCKKDKLVNSIY